MAGAIGPGSIVQAVVSVRLDTSPPLSITEGAIYRVRTVRTPWGLGSPHCEVAQGVCLEGQPDAVGSQRPGGPLVGTGWCLCRFRPWPPEPLSEPLEAQEPVMEAAR